MRPAPDANQDYNLLGASEVGGYTELIFERPRDTKDDNDLTFMVSRFPTVLARENEVRERIPVPHDNYLESIISSRPHCKGYFCLLFP